MRAPRAITKADVGRLRVVLCWLRDARREAKRAGARKTAERIRLAITSCGGAIRHAEGHAFRGQP